MDTGFCMNPSDGLTDIFTATKNGDVVGLCVSKIVSFTFTSDPPLLKIRYVNDPSPETFEGEMAVAISTGLRRISRLMSR